MAKTSESQTISDAPCGTGVDQEGRKSSRGRRKGKVEYLARELPRMDQKTR